MPPMLTVLGAFFLVYGITHIILLIRNRYWHGLFNEIIFQIKQRIFYLLINTLIVLSIITFLDKPIAQLCTKYYNVYVYTAWDFICSCGEGWFVAGVLLLAWFICDIFALKKISTLIKISLMSSIFAGILNGFFKFIFNRQRPSIGLDQWHFFRFFETGMHDPSALLYAFNSMPSGHVISTTAALVPLFLGIKQTKYKTMLVIWGILVAISRVYTMNHWLSDVIVSGIFGIIIGISCYKINSFRLKQSLYLTGTK